MRLQDWFAGLAGIWQLSRIGSGAYRFEGEAIFTPIDPTKHELTERGRASWKGSPNQPAWRQWQWHLTTEEKLEIWFVGHHAGKYHELRFTQQEAGWSAQDCHYCGADRYQGSYRIYPDLIETQLQIVGPRKNQTIAGRFERVT